MRWKIFLVKTDVGKYFDCAFFLLSRTKSIRIYYLDLVTESSENRGFYIP